MKRIEAQDIFDNICSVVFRIKNDIEYIKSLGKDFDISENELNIAERNLNTYLYKLQEEIESMEE